MNNQESTFKNWCIVELFGHTKIAGYCCEQNIAGTNMLRVDVPETKGQPSFTKIYGSGAVYAINPVDETTARMAAENIQVAPITIWEGESFTKKFMEAKPALKAANAGDEFEDEENAEYDL